MSDSDEQEQGFKVRDRRRFDADGSARADADSLGTSDLEREENELQTEAAPTKGDDDAIPQIDFSTFLLSLSTSAMVHLGEAPTPDGKTEKNLQLARQTIDMLAMLQQKTQGNLTEGESQLLGQLLYDLRVRYVQAAR
jgi:hypothetical protein